VSLPTWKENNELRLRVRHDVSSSIHFIPKGYISLDSGRLFAYVSERRQIRGKVRSVQPGCTWSRERVKPNEFILN